MADVHEPEIRSYNMSQIKGKDTKPEILVRKFLHAHGFRYRLHDKKLPGKPDIVLPKYNTIVMVHGCFWHGHDGCKYYVVPKTRTQWWLDKINTNRHKDEENEGKLKVLGWDVLTVFECELKPEKRDDTLINLIKKIRNGHTRN
ncbi:DNA mismatch endonuclease Vsr [Roseivirga sp. UBA1976]|uniref:very short patch repair endonuclease n=1 Tax=Roseivirga sp. UBA1976 TaxID=1947386 RepID=UPI00257AFE35|nr:DNA mismatch endonuclease Vsr [Roseivirga sp. UBA1976]MEC7756024.1 DNA mismatch endonuclease Vsr [Bacteroidota bacterium]|tara:strand:- start:8312 stop:8743 length:432 start_codon:yes stop_codon:yes gene_type:complete